jgi:CheY-like chemotaxis protein
MAKVLLVEDDNNLREIYEARLLAEGYTINSAKDGEEALVVAKAEKPDLIISDVMMPKISGFEMLDILRNTQGLKETKVIMLTALGQADDRTRADSLGADRYLVKSQVTLEDIVKAAHELLEGDSAPAAVVPTVATTDNSMQVAAAPGDEPAVAPTPTPQMAVSEPPAAPVAPEPTAPVVATPDPTPVAAPEPVAEPVVAAASTEPAPEPAAPEATHSFIPPSPSTEEPTQPAAQEPVSEGTPEAPAPSEPTEPVAAAEPTTVAPDAPDESSTEEPAPSIELPTLPTEEAAVTPAPEATQEAPATPEPTAEPAAEAPTNTDLPASESTADEQATVNSQIEEFIKNNAVEVPTEAPTPPPNATTDRVMQESVDSLIASAEHEGITIPPAAEAPAEAPAPAPEAPTPEPTTEADTAVSDNDGVTIAHKKVIARPSSAATPDLGELLAREEAKKIVTDDAPANVVTDQAPAPTPAEPSTHGQAPLPGNTFSPTNGTASDTDKPTDPNSIAL